MVVGDRLALGFDEVEHGDDREKVQACLVDAAVCTKQDARAVRMDVGTGDEATEVVIAIRTTWSEMPTELFDLTSATSSAISDWHAVEGSFYSCLRRSLEICWFLRFP